MEKTVLAEKLLNALASDLSFFWANAHPNLALEFPFGGGVGIPPVMDDPAMIKQFLNGLPDMLPEVTFSHVKTYAMADPNSVLLEYQSHCPKRNDYNNHYITIMKFSDGKLISFKEYFNPMEVARALAPAS